MKHTVFFHIALFAIFLAFAPLSSASAEEQTNKGPAHVGIEQRREELREKVTGTDNDAPAAQIEPAAGEEAPAADETAAPAAAQEQPENAQAQAPAAETK